VSCDFADISLKGARVAIQGYGNVGKAAARFLAEKGALLVAASDTGGTIYNPRGLDHRGLNEIKASKKSVVTCGDGTVKKGGEIFGLDCDILIPAATPDVINMDNVESIRAKLVIQGANIPATADAEKRLQEKGIVSVPDFVANAGGVIMAAMEFEKRTEREAFEAIETRIRKNTKLVLERSRDQKVLPRQAAVEIARERVVDAMKYREY
jgi:glutamate dehydrogenase/leucine dehydrogenase